MFSDLFKNVILKYEKLNFLWILKADENKRIFENGLNSKSFKRIFRIYSYPFLEIKTE